MKKTIDDITVYGGEWGERSESDPPAINVKCRSFGHDAPEGCITDQLVADYQITELAADTVGEKAWEATVRDFWESVAPALAEEHLTIAFPEGYEIEQEGRSGGWLV